MEYKLTTEFSNFLKSVIFFLKRIWDLQFSADFEAVNMATQPYKNSQNWEISIEIGITVINIGEIGVVRLRYKIP